MMYIPGSCNTTLFGTVGVPGFVLCALVVRWTREAGATVGESMCEEMGNKGEVEKPLRYYHRTQLCTGTIVFFFLCLQTA